MIQKSINIKSSKVLILGVTFKENCPDIRNSRVVDIIEELNDYGCEVEISDYWADEVEVKNEYGFDLTNHSKLDLESYEAVVVAVAHDKYKTLKFDNENQVVFDIKSILDNSDGRL